MLPSYSRLRKSSDFTRTVRKGKRSRRGACVVYLLLGVDEHPPRVGFVVSRSVGNAVVRHQVTRRLRHWAKESLLAIPDGAIVVVRVVSSGERLSFGELKNDCSAALGAVLQQFRRKEARCDAPS